MALVVRPMRSLRLWLLAAAVLALFAVAAGAIGTLVTRELVRDSATELNDRLRPAQSEAQRLATAYLNQETGQRGYLLTGDKTFLAPYDRGVERSRELRADLRRDLAGHPTALARLDEVERTAKRWHRHTVARIERIKQEGAASAGSVAREETDKRLFDALRDRLGALYDQTGAMVTAEVDHLGSAQRAADIALVVALLLALCALGATVVLLRVGLTRPLRHLLHELDTVAAGDYQRHITMTGPDELQRIAIAAESMRVSVVESSHELVAAQQELIVQSERQRMAADLHDTTIQRVFALGLRLSAVASQRTDLAETLNLLIDEADDIIRELRNMIFEMGPPDRPADAVAPATSGVPGGGQAREQAGEQARERGRGHGGRGRRQGGGPAPRGAGPPGPPDWNGGLGDTSATDEASHSDQPTPPAGRPS